MMELAPILGYQPSFPNELNIIGTGPAILAGAGISGATSLAGGKKGASAATDAAQLQFQAAEQNIALQQQIRQQNVNELQPFVDYGAAGIPDLVSRMGALTSPIDTSLPSFTFQPTMADLINTPGYQFTLTQGLEAEQARLGAMELGASGSAVRGAGQYAAGLASQTWPQVFNANLSSYQTNINSLLAGRTMDLQQRQQILSMLAGRVQTGLSAGGALAGANLQSGSAIGSAITGAGAAQASGVVGSANSLIAGLQGAGSAVGSGLTTNALLPLILQNAGGNTLGINADPGLAYMQNPNLMVNQTP